MNSSEPVGTIRAPWRFPVKSMLGEELEAADLSEGGIVGDRARALRDSETGKVASAKHPKLWPNLLACRATFVEPPRPGDELPPARIELADGSSVGNARVLFDAANLPGLGGPDGLAIDQVGTIFATGLERVFVFAPDGSHLGSIFPGSLTSNVAWGEDGSSLFITADRRLLRLRLGTRGIGF